MAIYHLSCSIKTGPTQSAVAASSYISGESIYSNRDQETKRYGRVERILDPGGIMTPEHIPDGIVDRASLWNAVEALDGRRGQMCRSWNVALPHELSFDQQRELAQEFIRREFVSRGMIADWAIHNSTEGENVHLHVLTTMRPIVQGKDGCWTFGAKARSVTERDTAGRAICIGRDKTGHKRYRKRKVPTIDWNNKATLVAIRAGWAAVANECLARAGASERIDHRSYADQGVEQLPTVHVGYAATAMEKRGQRSERGDTNRSIRAWNRAFNEQLHRIDELRAAIETERLRSEMPWNLDARVPWLMELRERMQLMLHQAKAEREAALPQTALSRRLAEAIEMADAELDRIETAGKATLRAQKGGSRKKSQFTKAVRHIRVAAAKAAQDTPPDKVMDAVLRGVAGGAIPPAAIHLEGSDDDGLRNWALMTELEKDDEKNKQILREL